MLSYIICIFIKKKQSMITKDDEQYLDNPDYNMTFEKYIMSQYYKENYRIHNTI